MEYRYRKLESPSAERNKDPIWTLALKPRVLPPILDGLIIAGGRTQGDEKGNTKDPGVLRVLEVAAGAGVHMQHFALNVLHLLQKQPRPLRLQWYPTDASRSSLASQHAYRDEHRDVLSEVVQEPLLLTLNEQGIVESDTHQQLSRAGEFHLILCINMVHIAPWSATIGLFQMASQFLLDHEESGAAALVLYGPFRVKGSMVESNVRFDGWLKGQDPRFGVRNVEDVVEAAGRIAQLSLDDTIEMPANNLCLVFRRRRRESHPRHDARDAS